MNRQGLTFFAVIALRAIGALGLSSSAYTIDEA